MAAAIRVIAAQGLSAPTAKIAHEAGVSNGTLFTYFETKADLLNRLYLDLKAEAAAAALDGLPAGASLRDQVFHMWSNWMSWRWRTRKSDAPWPSLPFQTRSLQQAELRRIRPWRIAELLERSRANGAMRNVSMSFVVAILNSLADATMDFMIHDPTHAKKHCKVGFDALWRAIS